MKRTKTQEGITLIALIITIVVLLILAIVTIGSVRDSGIIGHAQNAAREYNQAKTNEVDALTSYEGLIEDIIRGETIEDGSDGELIDGIVHEGTIPEGGTYTTAEGTVYNAGQNFPSTVTAGDVYSFGDYEYKYNYIWIQAYWAEYTILESSVEGWGVKVTDATKSEYETILTSINKKNITNMVYTFAGFTELITAPYIPSGVQTMYGTFQGCTKLTTMPDMSRAVNLTDMGETFYGCTSLENVTAIPNSVIVMDYTFNGCTALETAPAIPSNVDEMGYTFNKCTNLTGDIEINANPSSYARCFANTVKEIIIKGSASSETKAALAGTATNGNVSY